MRNFLLENISYLIWSVLFGIACYYFVNRRTNNRLFKPFHLFLIVFSVTFYWIPQGLDITDEGFVLTKSWFMLHGMWHQNVDMTWGSTLLNGLWLTIAGKPDILWARIGYVFIISLIITFSYKTLILNFERSEAFIIAGILGMTAFSGSPQTISYQNLPVFAIVTGFFYFIRASKNGRKSEFFLAGLFISISVMLRFPNLVLVFFMVLYFIIKVLYTGHERNQLKKEGISFLFGVSSGLLFGFLVLLISRSLHDFYFNSLVYFEKSSENTHSSFNLIKSYNRDLWRLFSKAIFVILPLLGISMIGSKDKRNALRFFIVIFSSCFAYFTLDYYGDSQNWVFLILAIGISSLIIYLILNDSTNDNFEIIFCSLLLYFISFIGSNNGMYILFWSGAIILPVSAFILLMKHSSVSINNHKNNLSLSFFAVLLFVSFVLISRKPDDVYRDRPRAELTKTFNSKGLKSLRSTSDRVSVTDSLISFMGEKINKQESLFIVGPVPIFYFLLNKKPLITNIWTCPPQEFEKLRANNTNVDYFLIPKNDPRDNNWPNSGKYQEPSEINMVQYYLNYIKDNGYVKKYESSMFYIYAAPGLMPGN